MNPHPQLRQFIPADWITHDPVEVISPMQVIDRTSEQSVLGIDSFASEKVIYPIKLTWPVFNLDDAGPHRIHQLLGYPLPNETDQLPHHYDLYAHHENSLLEPISCPTVFMGSFVWTSEGEFIDIRQDPDQAIRRLTEIRNLQQVVHIWLDHVRVKVPMVVIGRSCIGYGGQDRFEMVLEKDYSVFGTWLSQRVLLQLSEEARTIVNARYKELQEQFKNYRPDEAIERSREERLQYFVNLRKQRQEPPTPSEPCKGTLFIDHSLFGCIPQMEVTEDINLSPLVEHFNCQCYAEYREFINDNPYHKETVERYLQQAANLSPANRKEFFNQSCKDEPTRVNLFKALNAQLVWQDKVREQQRSREKNTTIAYQTEVTPGETTMYHHQQPIIDRMAVGLHGINNAIGIQLNGDFNIYGFFEIDRSRGIFKGTGQYASIDMCAGILHHNNGNSEPMGLPMTDYVNLLLLKNPHFSTMPEFTQNVQYTQHPAQVPMQPVPRPSVSAFNGRNSGMATLDDELAFGEAVRESVKTKTQTPPPVGQTQVSKKAPSHNPFDDMDGYDTVQVDENKNTGLDEELHQVLLQGVARHDNGQTSWNQPGFYLYEIREKDLIGKYPTTQASADLSTVVAMEAHSGKFAIAMENGECFYPQISTSDEEQLARVFLHWSKIIHDNRVRRFYEEKKNATMAKPSTTTPKVDMATMLTGISAKQPTPVNKPAIAPARGDIASILTGQSRPVQKKQEQVVEKPESSVVTSPPVPLKTEDEIELSPEDPDLVVQCLNESEKIYAVCGVLVDMAPWFEMVETPDMDTPPKATALFKDALDAVLSSNYSAMPMKDAFIGINYKHNPLETPWLYWTKKEEPEKGVLYDLASFWSFVNQIAKDVQDIDQNYKATLPERMVGLFDKMNGRDYLKKWKEMKETEQAEEQEKIQKKIQEFLSKPQFAIQPGEMDIRLDETHPLTIRRLACALHNASPIVRSAQTHRTMVVEHPECAELLKSVGVMRSLIASGSDDTLVVESYRLDEEHDLVPVRSEEFKHLSEQELREMVYKEWKTHFGETKLVVSLEDFVNKFFMPFVEETTVGGYQAATDRLERNGQRYDPLTVIPAYVAKLKLLATTTFLPANVVKSTSALLVGVTADRVILPANADIKYKEDENQFELVLLEAGELDKLLEEKANAAEGYFRVYRDDDSGDYEVVGLPPRSKIYIDDFTKEVFDHDEHLPVDVSVKLSVPHSKSVPAFALSNFELMPMEVAGSMGIQATTLVDDGPEVNQYVTRLCDWVEEQQPFTVNQVFDLMRADLSNALKNKPTEVEHTVRTIAILAKEITAHFNHHFKKVLGDGHTFIGSVLTFDMSTLEEIKLSRYQDSGNYLLEVLGTFLDTFTQTEEVIGIEGSERIQTLRLSEAIVTRTSMVFPELGLHHVTDVGAVLDEKTKGFVRDLIEGLKIYTQPLFTDIPLHLFTEDGVHLEIHPRQTDNGQVWMISMS